MKRGREEHEADLGGLQPQGPSTRRTEMVCSVLAYWCMRCYAIRVTPTQLVPPCRLTSREGALVTCLMYTCMRLHVISTHLHADLRPRAHRCVHQFLKAFSKTVCVHSRFHADVQLILQTTRRTQRTKTCTQEGKK
jgi:hypothetical protein